MRQQHAKTGFLLDAMTLSLLPDTIGATFSPCMRYRYRLWRVWDDSRPLVLFLMLNPSIADETIDDATVKRCQRRALDLGYGGIHVANLFALRSTNPKALREVDDPVGVDNDEAIMAAAKACALVICGWGSDKAIKDRGDHILKLLRAAGVTPHALSINADGSPKHPLYVSYNAQPAPFNGGP